MPWVGDEWYDFVRKIPLSTQILNVTAKGLRFHQRLSQDLPSNQLDEVAKEILHKIERQTGLKLDEKAIGHERFWRTPSGVREDLGYWECPYFNFDFDEPIDIDPSKLRAVSVPVRDWRPERAPLEDLPQTYASDWPDRIASAGTPRDGDRHNYTLALCGALCEQGFSAESVADIVENVACKFDSRSPAHHRRNALTTVQRWKERKSVAGIEWLREHYPRTAREMCRKTVSNEPFAIQDGVCGAIAYSAPCGTGKTRAAEELALARALRGEKTALAGGTNLLASQMFLWFSSRGIKCVRVYGVASVEGDDGCKYREIASSLSKAKLPILIDLCKGRGKRCDYYDTCKVKDAYEGDKNGPMVFIGTHHLVSRLIELIGVNGLLIIDEPGALIKSRVIDRDLVYSIAERLHYFREQYASDVMLSLSELIQPTPNIEAATAAWPDYVGRMIKTNYVQGAKLNPELARSIGDVGEFLGALDRVLTCTGGTWRCMGPGDNDPIHMSWVDENLAMALNHGSVVLMSADIDYHVPLYSRFLGAEIPVKRFDGPDKSAVYRKVYKTSRASRKAMIDSKGRMTAEAFRLMRLVAKIANGRKFAVVTFKTIEDEANRYLKSLGCDFEIGHFQGLRGLDHWKHFDVLITIGDPLLNLEVARTEAEFAGIDDRVRASDFARFELEQAHGRLRTVHRETTCWQYHIGRVVPAGNGWEDAEMIDVEREEA